MIFKPLMPIIIAGIIILWLMVRRGRQLKAQRNLRWGAFASAFSKPSEPQADGKEYWAVIFTTKTKEILEGYEETNTELEHILKDFPGFIGVESARSQNGVGITVSYWQDQESIRKWRENERHQEARALGKKQWYQRYHLRVCKVMREYEWTDH